MAKYKQKHSRPKPSNRKQNEVVNNKANKQAQQPESCEENPCMLDEEAEEMLYESGWKR